MDRLYKQEQSEPIRGLRELLSDLPAETRSENQWKVIENELFARLDADVAREAPRLSRSRAWSGMPARIALAASVVAAVAATVSLRMDPSLWARPLETASLLSSTGSVTITSRGSSVASAPFGRIARGQVIETGSSGSAVIGLEEGTGLVLAANTRVRVMRADLHTLLFHLDHGSLVARVSKRAPNETFAVRTANARCRVIGTVFRVEAEAGKTHLSVFRGSVEISHRRREGIRAVVETGEMVTLEGETLATAVALTEAATPVRYISILKLALEEVALHREGPAGIVEFRSTPPGAKVVVGNVILGTTPIMLVRPAGPAEVEYILDGYRQARTSVQVEQGGIAMVETALEEAANLNPPEPRRSQTARRGRRPGPPPANSVEDRPEFVEALIQLTVGEYRKALGLLDSLNESPYLDLEDRVLVLEKVRECYRSLGDFERALDVHEQRFSSATTSEEKASALWQMAMIRGNCLGEYEAAKRNLTTYIVAFPEGAWREEARLKLAELQALTGDPEAAIGTYQKYLDGFSEGANREKAMYAVARLLAEHRGFGEAVGWYERLVEAGQSSRYREGALFRLAECLERMGKRDAARRAFTAYARAYPDGHWAEDCAARLGRAAANN